MKLLFVCTHNCCRSILCEAIASQRGVGVLKAASAGSAPVEVVHPLTSDISKSAGTKLLVCKASPGMALRALNLIG